MYFVWSYLLKVARSLNKCPNLELFYHFRLFTIEVDLISKFHERVSKSIERVLQKVELVFEAKRDQYLRRLDLIISRGLLARFDFLISSNILSACMLFNCLNKYQCSCLFRKKKSYHDSILRSLGSPWNYKSSCNRPRSAFILKTAWRNPWENIWIASCLVSFGMKCDIDHHLFIVTISWHKI